LSKGRSIKDVWDEIMVTVNGHVDPQVLKMYTFKTVLSELELLTGWCGQAIPEPLCELYSYGEVYAYPWSGGIDFIDPRTNCFKNHDELLHKHAPPMQLPPQVRGPVHYGPKMVPFAYYADSYYCLDCDPVLEEGGVLHQVVNVSYRTGKVKVVEKNLLAFLEKGLKKRKKEIEEDRKADAERNANLNSSGGNSKEKPDADEMPPAMAGFAEKFMKMIGDGMNALQSKAAAGEAPSTVEEAGAMFDIAGFKEANRAHREEYLATLPKPESVSQDVEALRQQAQALIAQNPKIHPVQKACARLLELYVEHAECPAPYLYYEEQYTEGIESEEGPKLIERIKGTSEGLSDEAIHAYENALGVTFPEDLRALLQAHEFIAHGGRYHDSLGISRYVAEECQDLNEVFAEYKTEEDWALWPGTRVPVMGKNLIPIGWEEPKLCYDLNPGPGGVVGQLVSVDNEDSTCKVEYPSLLAMLEDSIREIGTM
jgi:cell wall assembly regulator SMI1